MTKSNLSTRTLTVPANVPLPVSVDGEFFVVESATGDFQVRIGGGEWLPGEAYVRRRLPNPDTMSKLTFLATAEVTLTVVYGTGDYDNKKSIAEIPGPVTLAEPAGTLTPHNYYQPNDEIEYTGVLSLSVFNNGAVDIAVNGEDVKPGELLCWPMVPRIGLVYDTINIDTTPNGGGSALVVWVGGTQTAV